MQYWWVNQNQTYKHETAGGFLWSPKVNKVGGRSHFYDNMIRVKRGDLILSFCDTLIKAVGVATGPAESAEKPNFGVVGNQWQNEGWLVPVDFTEVKNPVRPKDFVNELLPFIAKKYAPLQNNGNGNQGTYLAEISEGFFDIILEKIGQSASDFNLDDKIVSDAFADEQQVALEGRTDIGATFIEQLVKARRGQGIFKTNVRLNETSCRFTGISDPTLLTASHIKPWAKCSDFEKLDGSNGLLLSPHIDRLFDRGLIGFEDDGTVMISTNLDPETLTRWALDGVYSVGKFNSKQAEYLKYHREYVLKQAAH